jgi:hypothetical protein
VLVSVAQFMAGAPEVSVIAMATLLLWMGASETSTGRRLAGWLRWSALVALVIGIAAIQLLPTAELLSESSRGAGLQTRTAAIWSMHPARLAELVLPGVFGPVHTLRDADFWGRALVDQGFPYLLSVYFGWPVLLFAAYGAVRQGEEIRISRRVRAFLAVAAVGGITLALGRYLPGFSLLFEHVPGATLFRFPSKFALASVLPLAILAGCGVDGALSGSRDTGGRSRLRRWWVGAAWVGLAVMTCLTLVMLISPSSRAALIESVFLHPADAVAMAGVVRSLLHACGALLGCCLLLTAVRRTGRSWFGWGAAILILADLWIAGINLNPSSPSDLLRDPPPAAKLASNEIDGGRLFSDILPSGVVINAPTNDVVWRYRFNLEVLESELGANFGLPVILHEDLARMAPLELMELRQLLLSLPWERRIPVLSTAGVSLVLSSSRVVHHQLELISAVPNRGVVPRYLYRNLALPPPVRAVTDIRWARTDTEAAELISTIDFDPRSAVVLLIDGDETAHGGAVASGVPHDSTCDPSLTVEASSPASLRVLLDSPCTTVVSSDRTLAPGWKARIDGEEVAVQRANVAFMAVHVPAGKHLVELSYQPRTLLLGLWISLISVAALWLAAIFFGRQER